ncbi:MAG: DUF6092 family protein [Ignavibacteriales bacterium]
MDAMEAIRGRRSVRRFDARPVPRDLVEEIVRAGTWAPSGGNTQPVRYVVVDDRETIAKMRVVSPGMAGSDPAVLIVMCLDMDLVRRKGGDSGRTVSIMDVAMAAQNVQIAAHTLGLGTCAIASFLGPSISLILDIPENLNPVLMVSLGYPAGQPASPKRRPLDEVLHWGRFSSDGGIQGDREADSGECAPGEAAAAKPYAPHDSRISHVSHVDVEAPHHAGPGDAGPGELDNRLLQVLCFLAVCARNCVDEPAAYGPLRLIEAASELINIMVAHGLDSHALAAVRETIEASRDCVMTDHARFVGMLDEVARLLTARLSAAP